MKFFTLIPLALLIGCANVRQTATTTTTNPTNGVVTVTTATSSIYVVGDAKNTVDKARASAGKTSTVGASGVTEESTSQSLEVLLKAVFEAGRKSVIP